MKRKLLMISLLAPVVLLTMSCRSERPGRGEGASSESRSGEPEKAAGRPQEASPEPGKVKERPTAIGAGKGTYAMMREDLSETLASFPVVREKHQFLARREEEKHRFLARREEILKMLHARRDLIFSIPVRDTTAIEREEAWDILELGKNGARGGLLDYDQISYATRLINSYLEAPQIEKLVIWEVVRTRMDYSMADYMNFGSATGTIILKREMAKLLFSAFAIERQDLFDATDLKTRSASSEAERDAETAEEEIAKIYEEKAPEAEKILERY